MEFVGVVLVGLLIVAAIQRTAGVQARQKKKDADHSWDMHLKKMREWDCMKEEQMTSEERQKRADYLAQLEERNEEVRKRKQGE